MEEQRKNLINQENDKNSISELVNLMATVDVSSPEAKLNATTISDGNGGRIYL